MRKRIKRLLDEQHYSTFKKIVGVLSLDAIVYGAIYSLLFKVLIDLVNNNFTQRSALIYSALILVFSFVRFFVLNKGYYMAQADGERITCYLRVRLGDELKKLNMGYFNKNNIGTITNLLTNDLQDFEMFFTHQVSDLMVESILIVYLSVIMLIYNFSLGIIQVGLFLVCLPFVLMCSRAIGKRGIIIKNVRSSMISRIIEYVKGIEVFKSYGMVGESFDRLKTSIASLKRESIKLELAGIPYIIPLQLFVGISFPLVLFLAVMRYKEGSIDQTSLVTFVIISMAFTAVVLKFSLLFVQSAYFSLSVKKLVAIVDSPKISYDVEDYSFPSYDIGFEDVNFSYVKDKPVLKNVSFVAKQGEKTALVGASGSGKTTVLNLIARFWDVDSGAIKIGGFNINRLNPDALLSHISMVFQDVYLLEDTIYENIRIGNQNATEEEVIEAAKAAYCHEFVEKMEHGYQTMVMEGGASLSGGEKQRISIARALLKKAPIILLDEATASLDVDNEHKIQESLNKLTKDKTVVVIAHRLNTIKDSDKIVVFDQGNIMESGTHEELMKSGEKYAKMYTTMSEAKDWVL